MANSFRQKLVNAFLGTPQPMAQPQVVGTPILPDNINNFVQNLGDKPYIQKYLTGAKETTLDLPLLQSGVTQGLNRGIPELAKDIEALGIRTPKTEEEIEDARAGQFNQYPTTLQAGVNNAPRQGGILNDMFAGAKENYNQGFNPQNWGQKKNWATRIGEGLGTGLRFLDSSLGRGLIAGGLVGALGGTPAEMAAYGLTAGVGRQRYKTADELYRQQLQKQGIDTNGIYGNITGEDFKNLALDNYRTNTTNYRNVKLDYDSYTRYQKILDDRLQNNRITPEEYVKESQALKAQYENDIKTVNTETAQKSNQTLNTESMITHRQAMEQIAQARNEISRLKASNDPLKEVKIKKYQAEIEYLNAMSDDIKNGGGSGSGGRPVGERPTNNGKKSKVF